MSFEIILETQIFYSRKNLDFLFGAFKSETLEIFVESYYYVKSCMLFETVDSFIAVYSKLCLSIV